MAKVTIRELRNHGGAVVDRAAQGEPITITRAGKSVAELRSIVSTPLSSDSLLNRWRTLPPLDGTKLRQDLDEILDSTL